jgi:hypothetical protein
MGRKVTLYDYLASNVPSDAYAIISEGKENMPKPKNYHELSAQIKKYVTKNGETALLRLAEIHPDRELIEAISYQQEEPKKDDFSNLSGNVASQDKEYINNTKLLVVGGFILIGLAIIMTKK